MVNVEEKIKIAIAVYDFGPALFNIRGHKKRTYAFIFRDHDMKFYLCLASIFSTNISFTERYRFTTNQIEQSIIAKLNNNLRFKLANGVFYMLYKHRTNHISFYEILEV